MSKTKDILEKMAEEFIFETYNDQFIDLPKCTALHLDDVEEAVVDSSTKLAKNFLCWVCLQGYRDAYENEPLWIDDRNKKETVDSLFEKYIHYLDLGK